MWNTKNINIESCWFGLDIHTSCDASQFRWQEKLNFLQHPYPNNNAMILHHGEGRGQKQTNQAVDISHGKCFTKIWSYFHLSYFTNHFPGDTLTARHAHRTSLPCQYCNMLTSIQYLWVANAIQFRPFVVHTWTTFQYQWVVTTPIQHHPLLRILLKQDTALLSHVS